MNRIDLAPGSLATLHPGERIVFRIGSRKCTYCGGNAITDDRCDGCGAPCFVERPTIAEPRPIAHSGLSGDMAIAAIGIFLSIAAPVVWLWAEIDSRIAIVEHQVRR